MNVYSWEIDNYLRTRDWEVTRYEYLYVTDMLSNPQIRKIKYEPFNNSFYMETADGYNWIFRVKE